MSISFEVYRVGQQGERELVTTTQSARVARELRDAAPGETFVVGRDDWDEPLVEVDGSGDVEGDYPV